MKKKTLLLSLTAVIMVAALAVGGTLAYFTDNEDAENTFTVGNVAIDLYEHLVAPAVVEGQNTWVYALNDHEQKIETEENDYDNIYPGAEILKDPTVDNDGRTPAYVRVKITLSDASKWNAAFPSGVDLSTIFLGFNDTKWKRVGAPTPDSVNNTLTYEYEYQDILAPLNGTTGPMFTSIKIPVTLTNEDMDDFLTNGFNIKIVAEAIQSDGFTNTYGSDGNTIETSAAQKAFAALTTALTPTP